MNLTRLRQSTWFSSILEYYKEYRLKITWGDQDLINIYFHYHPGDNDDDDDDDEEEDGSGGGGDGGDVDDCPSDDDDDVDDDGGRVKLKDEE